MKAPTEFGINSKQLARRSLSLAVALALVMCGGAKAGARGGNQSAANESISGEWEFYMERYGEPRVERCILQAEGEQLTGKGPATFPVVFEGTIRGNEVEFKARLASNNFLVSTFKGVLEKSVITGTNVYAADFRQTRWTARRPAVRPEGSPRIHNFEPQQFHRVITGSIPPALRIFPGDTVKTTSVDAGGRNERGARLSLGGNPLTGPFFIEGALPGDTLVIRLNRVRLNSEKAQSGWNIVSNALVPGHLLEMKRETEFNSNWKLDKERGVAVLAEPTERLKNFAVPLQPIVGCIAVAPPWNEGVITRDSGRHGGNMDYNHIREGATVYLPVFQPGALLFIGDGHAAQGDGELTGDALETTLELEFTVDVVREKIIGAPRAENDEYLMAIGIAGSLDDAMKRATSEMARWVEQDYKLNASEIGILFGTSMRYDVADLVGAQVSIVAKISKKALAQLSPPND